MKSMNLVLLGCFGLCLNSSLIGQQAKPLQQAKFNTRTTVSSTQKEAIQRPVLISATTVTEAKKEELCKPMDIRRTETLLRERVGRTLKVLLDKDYGFIEILGNKQNVRFSEYKVRAVAHEWVYTMEDIKSNITRVEYKENKYVMKMEFEDEGPEIKGRCPGCRVGQDNRAPDINWNNPALQIIMTPVAYNNSFTFAVEKVEMQGRFEVNGQMDKFLPSLTVFFRNNMERAFKDHMQRTFNSDQVKRMLGDVFKPEVQRLGLTEVKKVDMSRDNIYLCNF
jgi:hypothetical protein